MDLYLPIANMSVNALVIVALGLFVGLLSGMFGVGGGFLTTPLLIIYGIPPTVAAASSASQVTGASVSGVFAHLQRRGVDFKMGGVMVAGGFAGSAVGAWIFRLLQQTGQIDTVIAIIYVLLLGLIGSTMAKESIVYIRATRSGALPPARKRRHHPLIAALPFRMRFYRSGLYVSPLAPILLGFVGMFGAGRARRPPACPGRCRAGSSLSGGLQGIEHLPRARHEAEALLDVPDRGLGAEGGR